VTASGSRPPARRSATAAWTSPCISPIGTAHPGHLSRQGPPALRWALYEAAQHARFPNSPDRGWYLEAAERLGGNRACLALARKLLKRCYHTLRELGEDALAPPPAERPGSRAARRASSGTPRSTEHPATDQREDARAA
jgi:hypothetical protein